MRILIIEDNPTLADGLKQVLVQAGFAVDTLADGAQGQALLRQQLYDLLLLDLGLPGVDGRSILKQLRQQGQDLPVLIISARDQLDQRIEGLDLGADDYLCKPFELEEVLARVRALLRRSQQQANNLIRHGTLELDTRAQTLSLDGVPVDLHRRELAVLEYLLANTGRVVSKEQIAERISSFDDDVSSTAIETYVSRLRKKLKGALTLKTIRGLGYLLEADGADAGR